MPKSALRLRLHDRVLRIMRTTKDWNKAKTYLKIELLLS